LLYAVVGVLIFLQLAIPLLLSTQKLPEFACCVLVSGYSWNSYRPFTQKYQVLAAAPLEQKDRLKLGRTRKTSLNKQDFTPDYGRTWIMLREFQKRFFDMACEELTRPIEVLL